MRKTNHKKNSFTYVLAFSLATLIVGSLVIYRYFPRASAPNIFAINPAGLQYGDTTLTGTLQKTDSGTYLLVLADNRPVVLDAKGLDIMVNQLVSVSGYLSPQFDNATPLTMFVESITLVN